MSSAVKVKLRPALMRTDCLSFSRTSTGVSGEQTGRCRATSGVTEFSEASRSKESQSSGPAAIWRISSAMTGSIRVRAQQTKRRFSGQTAVREEGAISFGREAPILRPGCSGRLEILYCTARLPTVSSGHFDRIKPRACLANDAAWRLCARSSRASRKIAPDQGRHRHTPGRGSLNHRTKTFAPRGASASCRSAILRPPVSVPLSKADAHQSVLRLLQLLSCCPFPLEFPSLPPDSIAGPIFFRDFAGPLIEVARRAPNRQPSAFISREGGSPLRGRNVRGQVRLTG